MKINIITRCACALLFGIYACGSSAKDEGSAPTASIPQDQAAEALAHAICDAAAPCCQNAGFSYDAAGCRKVYSAFLDDELFGFPDTTDYDPIAVAACVDAVKRAAGPCDAPSTDGEACLGMVTGKQPAGASCTAHIECAWPPGVEAVGCVEGECVQERRGKTGEPCQFTCTSFPEHTYCQGGHGSGTMQDNSAKCFTNDGLGCGPDGRCAALAQIGQPCSSGSCASNAYCAGVCKPKVPSGSPCDNWDACAEGTFCDMEGSGGCEPTKPDGAACETLGECTSGDCIDGECGTAPFANPTTCSGQPSP